MTKFGKNDLFFILSSLFVTTLLAFLGYQIGICGCRYVGMHSLVLLAVLLEFAVITTLRLALTSLIVTLACTVAVLLPDIAMFEFALLVLPSASFLAVLLAVATMLAFTFLSAPLLAITMASTMATTLACTVQHCSYLQLPLY